MLSSVNYLSQASHQGQLETVLRGTFKGVDIKVNERKDIDVRHPVTGNRFELDVWIPSLALGFEFQDSYHFASTWYTQTPLHEVQFNDCVKRECMLKRGIDLVSVPCWWNYDAGSLHASIRFERPDILLDGSDAPVPLNPPCSFFIETKVPHVGDIMLASFIESTHSFSETLSAENPWWIGEKYDGVRAIWNPIAKQLYSRRAIEILVPTSLLHHLGSCALFLDGEAWQGRGLYNALGSTADGRELLRMIVFDDPSPNQRHKPFEARYATLVNYIKTSSPFLILAFRKLCSVPLELTAFLELVIKDGGEGVIARKPMSLYESGRSASLIKMKSARGDTEALVVKVIHDGSLVLELPSGVRFKVKKEETEVEAATGDVVTFEYENFSRRDVPVNPRVTRVRKDLTWEYIINTTSSKGFTTKPMNFWDDEKNVRKFFEQFALKRQLNPLDPSTWYSTSRASIETAKGGFRLCVARGGYMKAVMSAFPEIGLDETKFQRLPAGYFNDVNVRRESFIQFARANNFDPLVADNWYFSRRKTFLESAGDIVKYYGTVRRALVHLFPELKLDPSNLEGNYWSKARNRRSFFDSFARKHKFDPLIASNWYEISKAMVIQEENARIVLSYYEKSMVNALVDLYPEVELDKRKFTKKRKDFFDSFAKDHAFDPLVAANWYRVSRSEIMARENATAVMMMHHGSVVQTLIHVYPKIGLQENLFQMLPGKFWGNINNQKSFFNEIATSNGFDPLVGSNWNILQHKPQYTQKLHYILSFYRGSLSTALKLIYPSIQLDKLKFHNNYWTEAKNRRAFFEKFARIQGFDPLIPENWYGISRKDLSQNKQASYILQYHNNSFGSALTDLFPDVSIDKDMLLHLPRRYWANAENRRKFFLRFAASHSFDPLDPHMWYHVSRKKILNQKGGLMVIGYHSKSYQKALLTLFPNIGLDINKFIFVPRLQHVH